MDLIARALAAASTGSLVAPLTAFGAGVVSSTGPCAVPRFIAVSAMASSSRPGCYFRIASFMGGLAVGYTGIAMSFTALRSISALTPQIYLMLAVLFGLYGVKVLISRPRSSCNHDKSASQSIGASFFVGASFAMVASPCCTPILAYLASLASANLSLPAAFALVSSFVAGHVLLLSAAAVGVRVLPALERTAIVTDALPAVNAGLLLATAGYYGLLA